VQCVLAATVIAPISQYYPAMKILWLATIALAAQLARPAIAADLPVSPVYTPVTTPAVYSWWTGCYVGGSAGVAWSNVTYTAVNPILSEDFGFNPSSYIGGIQAGCQYQWTNWVFGLEGTFSATHLNQTHFSALIPNLIRRINIDKIGTIAPRVGYTWDRTMLFFKAGWAGVRVNAHAENLATAIFADFTDKVASGWTIGLGFEHVPWQNIVVGVEFDYYNTRFNQSGSDNTGGPFQFANTNANIYAATGRLSYLFGAPVLTNY
jgi:outer membrane immunogenic protein